MIVQLRRVLALAGAGLLTLVSACESQKPKYEGPYAAEVAQAVPMIEKAVGLKFKTPPKIETRSKEQVREFVTKQFTDSLAKHDIAGQEAAYKRLGMIPDTLKLQPFLTSLLEEQIVGYYDPHTKILYVVDGSCFVTSSGVNPTSTIVAIALRAADHMVETRFEQQVPA